jgi:large subunit ribosomal protein L23
MSPKATSSSRPAAADSKAAKPKVAKPKSDKPKSEKPKVSKPKVAKAKAGQTGASKGAPAQSLAARLSTEKLMSVLIGPHLSEKSSGLAERLKQFVFKVRRDADKPSIKRAVELMFDVKVTEVQVVNCMGKAKRFGRSPGRRQDWKKAYVSLAEGQDIDFLGAE